ncbi:MAG TPA: carbon-nitrogen hydrolase family protein [Gemmatimonadaceae bacterium]|jgi:predicted amidohydrolase|nr:carbon-nitrogen hydrolase family protein [Gemmatimonadaceae bacterium]
MTRVAIAQAEVQPSLDAGLNATRRLIREASDAEASLVVFPETWLPGYPVWLDVCRDVALWDHEPVKRVFRRMAEESVVVPGPVTDALGAAAKEAAVVLVVGVTERIDSGPAHGTLYNTVLTFDADGRLVNHHRKLVPTYTERMVWGLGDAAGLTSVETKVGRVGALVCWEHWMPLARQAMHDSGEDIHVALWPTAHEMLQVASRHYAFEGRCFVLAAASLMRASALPPELEPHASKVRSPDDWVLRGGSAVIGPDGRYLVEPCFDRPGLIVSDIDLGRVREERMTLDVSGHYHRPELLRLEIDRSTRR